MTLEEAPQDPFSGGQAGPEGPEGPGMDQGPEFNPYGLRNVQPAVTPEEIGRELDIHAEWWQHLGCGFVKQSGGTGTEAWMHYLMAGLILMMQLQGPQREEESSGEGDPAEEYNQQQPEETASGKPVYDGPQ